MPTVNCATSSMIFIMLLLSGNIFRFTAILWGESTSQRWIPLTKVKRRGPLMFLWDKSEQKVEQTHLTGKFEKLWRSFVVTAMWGAIVIMLPKYLHTVMLNNPSDCGEISRWLCNLHIAKALRSEHIGGRDVLERDFLCIDSNGIFPVQVANNQYGLTECGLVEPYIVT